MNACHYILLIAACGVGAACADLAGIEPGHLASGGAGFERGGTNAETGGVEPKGGTTETGGRDSGGQNTAGEAATGGTPNRGGAANASGTSGGIAMASGGNPTSAGGSAGTAGTASSGSGGGAASGGKVAGGNAATGGNPASGGNTATGGVGNGCTEGYCPRCPNDTVSVSSGTFTYCVQKGEVTNAEYLSFVQQRSGAWPIGRQPAACSFNASFQPDPACDGHLLDAVSASQPVRCVDWCDAHTYCRSIGLHLCGRMSGTPNRPEDTANEEADEWYAACSGPNLTQYPYGDDFDATKCNGAEYEPANPGPKSASKLTGCAGGVNGLLNLSGNVAEWNDTCEAANGASDRCAVRGGSFQDALYELRCAGSQLLRRDSQAEDIGFRCCAEISP